ncbi:MAG: Crp/Fnr family transcriptional regulator [Chloroflexi bacterium]|nr:Crp/Fnr family transcriptional regulator [Chloroflexota bacterium]
MILSRPPVSAPATGSGLAPATSPGLAPAPFSARAAVLRAQPYFALLDEADLEFLSAHLVEMRYAKGEAIFLEGEPCRGLYIVREGQARIYKLSPEGREQVLRYCGAGQSFNEVAVFDGGLNPANVSASTPCHLWVVPCDLIIGMVRKRPEMAMAIIRSLGEQMRHLVSLVEDLSLRNISARLAKLLLEIASDEQLPHKLTQQEMAAQLGTVREMVARSLKQLETRGLIKIERGRIVILDRQMLEKMV